MAKVMTRGLVDLLSRLAENHNYTNSRSGLIHAREITDQFLMLRGEDV